MKKVLSVLIAASLFFTLAISVFAAPSGEPAGYAAISVDANVIGAGYLFEPTLVPFYADETVADITDRFLGSENYNKASGSGFYVTGFKLTNDITANISSEIQDEIDYWAVEYEIDNEGEIKNKAGEFLSENDYWDIDFWGMFRTGSGWMYTVNNDIPSFGANEMKVVDGDVIRWQFTFFWGADIGHDTGWAEYMGGGTFDAKANKDGLIYSVASLNASANKTDLLKDSKILAAYNNANDILSDIAAAQTSVDDALSSLDSAVDSYVEPADPVDPIPTEKSFFERIVAFFKWLFKFISDLFSDLF